MTMAEARDLQADLAKLLLALHATAQPPVATTTGTVDIDGGAF
jgi:hypothetical protein